MIDRNKFSKVKTLLDPFISLKDRILTNGEIFKKVWNAMDNIGMDLVNGSESVRIHIQLAMGMDILKVYKKLGYSEPYNESVYPAGVVYESINYTDQFTDAYDTYLSETDRINGYAEELFKATTSSDFFLPILLKVADRELQYDMMSCLANYAIALSQTSPYATKEGIQWSVDYLAESANMLIENSSDLLQSLGRQASVIANNEDNSTYGISSHGYVYILTNESMPGLVKIGMTTNEPDQRVKELSSATGVPTEFKLVYYREFGNCREAEGKIHKILADRGLRYNSKREFFTVDTTEAINLLLSLPDNIVTYDPEVQSSAKEYVFTRKDYFDQREFEEETDARLDIHAKISETRAYQLYEQALKYHKGEGVLKDEDEAIYLFKQSMDDGYYWSRDFYAMLVAGDDIKKYIRIMSDAIKHGSVSAYMQIATKLTENVFYRDDIRKLDKEDKEQVVRCLKLFERDFYKAPDMDLVEAKVADYIALSLLFQYKYDRSLIKYVLEDVESGYLSYDCSIIDRREYIAKRVRQDWDDFLNKSKFRGYSKEDTDGLTSPGNTPSEIKERKANEIRSQKENAKKIIEQTYSKPFVNILLGLLCCSLSIIPCILYFAGWWMSCAFIIFTLFLFMYSLCAYPNTYTDFQDGTRIGDYISFGSWISNAFFLSLISLFPILMMTEWGTNLFFVYFDTSMFKTYEGGVVVFATILINLTLLAYSTFTILENFRIHDDKETYREVIDNIKENTSDVLKGFATSTLLIILAIGILFYAINTSSFLSIQDRKEMIEGDLSIYQIYE